MKKIINSVAIFLLFTSNTFAQSSTEQILVEVGKLKPEEYSFLSSIGNKEEGKLLITNDVKRYYKLNNGNKEYIRNELIYKPTDGLIDESYVYYNLFFIGDEYEMTINYSYSAGQAFSGNGTVIKLGETFVQTEITWGTGTRTTTILKNNKKVFEKTEDF